MSDQAARRRILESLDESLVVEAAAGTGKTTILIRRLVRLLASGRTTVGRLVAVTFTRKAAGELKLRLREELNTSRTAAAVAATADGAGSPERARLEDAIAHLEEARIGTIHSFCAELLRERPVEAGIDPAFVELDEEEAAALFAQVFDRWVQDALGRGSPELRRALTRLSLDGDLREAPLARLSNAAWQIAQWRDHPAPWRREAFDRAAEVAGLVAAVLDLAALAAQGPATHDLRRSLRCVEDEARWIARAGAAAPLDDDALEARLAALHRQLKDDRRKGSGRRYGPLEREDVVAAREALLDRLGAFVQRADADLAAALRGTLGGSLAAYEESKRRGGRLDFLDLLLLARDLVRDRPAVRADFQRRFTHLFIDEMQDTDPLQSEVLLLLASDDPHQTDWRLARPRPGALFLVGDPKQAIYRFRRADVTLYEEICERLAAAGVARLQLSTSYRAVRGIQLAVNAAFQPVMLGDRESGQAAYIPLDEERVDPPGQPTVVALPVPRPLGASGRVTKTAVSASLPGAVGGFLQWLLHDSGWQVAERGVWVPVEARHVAILFRRFADWSGDVSQPYLRELESRNLPHVLVGGRSFHGREEVETLRVALRAVEHPDDELSVFATLRGSLFALGDDTLLEWRQRMGGFHPFRPRPTDLPESLGPVADAMTVLAHLHRRRNQVPVGTTLQDLWRATHALAGFALRPAGQQVVANVQHIAELARGFESRGGLSFRRFVEQLDEQALSSESRQAPAMEEAAEGIRILTVHTAKGLEFPVVVLADIGCTRDRRAPSRVVDSASGLWAAPLAGWAPWDLHDHAQREVARDNAEAQRLAYVAATRARDLLVVPVTGIDEVRDGWVAALNPALYPAAERAHLAVAELAAGCPTRGSATVLEVPAGFPGGEVPPPSIRPGLHRARAGGHPVVWFDPAVLDLEPPRNFGLRQEHLLAEDAGVALVEAELDRHARWQHDLIAARAAGAEPSLRVARVTHLTAGPPAQVEIEEEILVPDAAAAPAAGRPAGRRFGQLVHNLLRDVPIAAGGADRLAAPSTASRRAAVVALATNHGRLLAAPPDEIAAAVEAALRVLAHPLLAGRAAESSTEIWREMPFCLPLADGSLVEGVIDLALWAGDRWWVVDFKTDLGRHARPGATAAAAPTSAAAAAVAAAGTIGAGPQDAYRRQLAWYVWAVATITGQPARGLLLGI